MCQWSWKKKVTSSARGTLPHGSIADAFKEYIHNEIPTRFIDTSKLRFVSRREVLRVFQNEIASVTEEQIQERIGRFDRGPFSTYLPQRETVLRQIIQEVVKYVILSHRWDEAVGEASYRDVSLHGKRSITRFKKLVQFCKTSKELGHKLAWVDTCCIDQTNSTELNEAINAMYKWYANSDLCAVYLAESTSPENWHRDPWFTRGWTLQELLAPKRLKFYGKDWRPLTTPDVVDDRTHDSITRSLSNLTGISEAVLAADHSCGVQRCSFWEIMSWASKRQTTRVEDRAYCLLGMFHVNFTISYGEGQHAFPRLVRAIIAKNPTWDIFTWFGQPSADNFVLPPSPASYPRFEARMSEGRAGLQEFSLTRDGLSLMSLSPIPLELGSVVLPTEPTKPHVITLTPLSESSLGTYGDLVVESGATRFETIQGARRLSACIINHHSSGRRRRGELRGKLVVGEEYICFLLYSEHGDDGEATWVKLSTDNLLRILFVEMPEKASEDAADGYTMPLVRTLIRSTTH